ncbi:uncharacterized protein LOC133894939 isoform X2 [Phragmites australis]|uniref:uncharacterized protein LOC133894939 isoform X2 n=1 Tax=Phragmites australis TaxID=29695 RepID=UPI002D794AB0|nr:uncharacterized protein LOC133894939 isoform X2 [Phragmites australis]
MVNGSAEKNYGIDELPSTSELPENKLRHNFRLGDLIWVKHGGSSWWPAQVIDEACVGAKPKKKAKHDCLVRLYGTCQYLYVDPWKSNMEFKMMLKQESKSAMEAFREVLEKELSCVNSSSDYDDEAVNSKGGDTKGTTEKSSSRKVRKQEGLEPYSYTDDLGDETEEQYNEGQDQEFGSTATTGVTVRKGKRGRTRQSSSTNDKEQVIDKASSEISSGSLRNKRQKQVARVLDKEDCKIGASVVRREGLRRSGRTNANEYLDASEDRTAEDSMVHGTSAPHGEIKAMVRDILFKEIIDRELDAEMAYVDEVINGICSATEDGMTRGATASRKVGRGNRQSGSRVEGESSNVTQRQRKGKSDLATEDAMQVTSPETASHTTSRDAEP